MGKDRPAENERVLRWDPEVAYRDPPGTSNLKKTSYVSASSRFSFRVFQWNRPAAVRGTLILLTSGRRLLTKHVGASRRPHGRSRFAKAAVRV